MVAKTKDKKGTEAENLKRIEEQQKAQAKRAEEAFNKIKYICKAILENERKLENSD